MKSIYLVFWAVFLSGCTIAKQAKSNDDDAYITNEVNKVLVELSKKAVEAQQITMKHQAAMARLSEPENGYQNPVNNIPEALEKIIPMDDFYGDALEPLRLVAKLTHYKFSVRGGNSNTISWVSLSSQSRSAYEIIDDVSNQIDKLGINVDIWSTPNSEFKGLILVTFPGAND